MNSSDKLIKLLNEANKLDPAWISDLVNYRPECNGGIAVHPTIQVGAGEEGHFLAGFLGLINGLFSEDERVAVILAGNNKIVRFCRMGEVDES